MSALTRLQKSFGLDDPILPIAVLPSATLDLATSQIDCIESALGGTGLFYDDFVRAQRQVTPRQYLKLLGNLKRAGVREDLPLRLGRKIAQLCSTPVNLTIAQSPSVASMIGNFELFCRLHSPLVQAQIQTRDKVYLTLEPVLELGEDQLFFQLTALSALITWLKQSINLANQFNLDLPIKPHNLHQLDSHIRSYLKAKPSANAPVLALVFETQFYHQTLPESHSLIYRQNRLLARKLLINTQARQGFSQGFCQLLQDQQLPDLPEIAKLLNISPATLKRKLKQQNTSYQKLLDRTRKYLALEELYLNGATNQDAAKRLGFNDIANFRRSFKRWTGLLPSQLRSLVKS